MRRTVIRALLSLAAIAPAALAAQGRTTITGTVTMADGGAPEGGVLVRIERLGVGTTSLPDGRYRLIIPADRFTPGDSVTVMASRLGLLTQQRTLVVQGDTSGVDFQVRPAVLSLQAIAVTNGAVAAQTESAPVSRKTSGGPKGMCGSLELVRDAGAAVHECRR